MLLKLLIRQGRLVDPVGGIGGLMDILIEDGKVAQHGPKEEIFPQILSNTVSGCSYMMEGAAQ